MGYRIVYVDQSEKLSLYLDNLKVETERGDIRISISDIQTLIIDNYRTVLSVRLMNELCNSNICTIMCGMDHLPCSYLVPMNGHFSSSGNIMKQISWNEEIKRKLQKAIVRGKIYNQVKILCKYHCDPDVIKKILQFAEEVQDGDPGNREGLAAKMYFRELFGPGFTRFENDVVNAGMNYGYSIFRSLIATTIVSKGYLPNIGLFHKGKENMFNLADDVIEVFRPLVDDFVRENLIDSLEFTKEDRDRLIRLTLGRVEYNGQTETIGNAISLYIDSILKCIDSNSIDLYQIPGIEISYDI